MHVHPHDDPEAPIVADATIELWEALGGAFTNYDHDHDWALLHYLDGTGHLLDRLAKFIRDSDTHSGWGVLLDPDTAPDWALPWTAQWVGVELRADLSSEAQRARIKGLANWRRGTPGAMRQAAAQLLTGSRIVRIWESWLNDPYRLRVVTLVNQTPDPARVRRAIEAEKPAGVVLEYETMLGQTWGDVLDRHTSWSEVRDVYRDWEAVLMEQPLSDIATYPATYAATY